MIKFKRLHKDAVKPTYASEGAACFDLYSVDSGVVLPRYSLTLRTGLAFEVEPTTALMIYSRSGHGFKNGIRLANSVGVIDSDYRGEVKVCLINDSGYEFVVNRGDRIAQAMIIKTPIVEIAEVDELSETARGANGFGSTGR